MESKIFQPNSKNILKASKILQEGGIVVFPTETVYGIGANALNDKAVGRIFAAKILLRCLGLVFGASWEPSGA